MRLPRMTTRRWMVAVAVVAFAIPAARIGNQWLAYRQKAVYHAEVAERGSILFLEFYAKYARRLRPKHVAYHAALARKYDYAARHPWLAVEPDPFEPP